MSTIALFITVWFGSSLLSLAALLLRDAWRQHRTLNRMERLTERQQWNAAMDALLNHDHPAAR